MDVWLLITLAVLHQAAANENWTCDFQSSTCDMKGNDLGACWSDTLVQSSSNDRYLCISYDCISENREHTAQFTIPREFQPGRWQLSFSFRSKDGFLNITSDCNGSVLLHLEPAGGHFRGIKLDLFCSSDFAIYFIAVRQTGNPCIGIDDISVSRQSVTPSESETDMRRPSDRVSSSVSMTTSALMSTWSPTAEYSAVKDGPIPAIVAVVSIVVVIAVVVMVAVVLFHRRRMGGKSSHSYITIQLDSSVHGDPSFSTAELHEDNGLGGDVHVSQGVIMERKATQGDEVNNACACGAVDDVASSTIDSGNVMPLYEMTEDIKTAAALRSNSEYDSRVRALNTRSKQDGQRKLGTIQQGNGSTGTGDEYQTLAQTAKLDIKTHAKTPGNDATSKTARNRGSEDGSATEHPLYQNLRAEYW